MKYLNKYVLKYIYSSSVNAKVTEAIMEQGMKNTIFSYQNGKRMYTSKSGNKIGTNHN